MPLQSDLVQESKLETSFSSHFTKHTYYKRGTSGRERRIRLQEKWERQKRLGQGAYGIVWLETCSRPVRPDSPMVRAVKEIPLDSMTSDEIDYHQELEAVMKFSQKQYTSFVKSFGWFESSEAIYITMEYLPHGDLQKFLTQPIPEAEAKMITCQLAEGLHHMHQNGFTHRDLKPGNILVVSEGPHWLVQISDFGISKRLRPEQATLGTMRRGTMGFIAPEMLNLVDDRGFPHVVDVWSLGAVLYRMLTKRFFLDADFNLLRQYTVAEIPFPTSELDSLETTASLKRLLQHLLDPSPKQRPSAIEVLSHEWIRDYAGISMNETLSEMGSNKSDNFSTDTSEPGDSQSVAGTEDIPSAMWSTDNVSDKALHPPHIGIDTTPKEELRKTGLIERRETTPDKGEALDTPKEEEAPQTTPEHTDLTARFIVDDIGHTIETLRLGHSRPPPRFDFKPPRPDFKNTSAEDSTELPDKGMNEKPETALVVPGSKDPSPSLGSKYMPPTVEDCTDDKGNSDQENRSITSYGAVSQTVSFRQSEAESHRSLLSTLRDYNEKHFQNRKSAEQRQSPSPSVSSSIRGQAWQEPRLSATELSEKKGPPREMLDWMAGKSDEATTQNLQPSIPRRPRERQGRAPGARTAYTEDIGDTLPRHAGNEVDYDDKKPVTLRTVSGKNITRQIATQNDAERWKVPAHYFLARWDPNKNPLLFLNLVFDAISLGAWMFDWVTFYEEEDLLGDKRVAATVKEFALLLEGLEDRSTSAYKYANDWNLSEKNRDMHADFLRGYHQLLSNLQYMLKVCVGFGSLRPIAGAEDQKRADKDYAAREMLAVLFDPDMKLNETAGFMYEMKRWQFWYDHSVEISVLEMHKRLRRDRENRESVDIPRKSRRQGMVPIDLWRAKFVR